MRPMGRTTDSPTELQESAQPYLRQECRGNTESWDRGWKLELDFLHGAWTSTEMQEKTPDPAETGMSIIPKVRLAVPVGMGVKLDDRLRGAAGKGAGDHDGGD